MLQGQLHNDNDDDLDEDDEEDEDQAMDLDSDMVHNIYYLNFGQGFNIIIMSILRIESIKYNESIFRKVKTKKTKEQKISDAEKKKGEEKNKKSTDLDHEEN